MLARIFPARSGGYQAQRRLLLIAHRWRNSRISWPWAGKRSPAGIARWQFRLGRFFRRQLRLRRLRHRFLGAGPVRFSGVPTRHKNSSLNTVKAASPTVRPPTIGTSWYMRFFCSNFVRVKQMKFGLLRSLLDTTSHAIATILYAD